MGYLDNSTITVDAILTKKGRELLARGRNEFNITHSDLAFYSAPSAALSVFYTLGGIFIISFIC